MSSNITQMPVITEFVRAYPTFLDENTLGTVSLHAMMPFRVLTDSLLDLLKTTMDYASEAIENDYHLKAAVGLINFQINSGLASLKDEGKVIVGEIPEGLMASYYLPLYDYETTIATCDGYTVFNSGYIPPTPSSEMH